MSTFPQKTRAMEIRTELLGDSEAVDADIPEHERKKVLSTIEIMLEDERQRGVDMDVAQFSPERRAFILPILLNAGALLVLAIAAFITWRALGSSEIAPTNTELGLESAEGLILQKILVDTEAQLGEKDREIADIRGLMADLETQKASISTEYESQLAEREAELREEFDIQLANERKRLIEAGISGITLQEAMKTFETSLRATLEADLEKERAAIATERERRFDELENQRSTYAQQISLINAQRGRLQSELDARNAELQRLKEQQALEQNQSSRQLEELQRQQETDRSITDQILSYYSRANQALTANSYEEASRSLNSLEQYLQENTIRGRSVVANRRELDRILISSMRQLIAFESVAQEADLDDERNAEILARISAGAGSGNRLAASGNLTAANQAWEKAFSDIPELQQAFTSAVSLAATDTRAEQTASSQDEEYERGVADGLSQSATEIDRQKALLAELSDRIVALQERYSSALIRVEEDVDAYVKRTAEHLAEKLDIKRGLDPALHGNLDEYANTIGQQGENEGKRAAYAEMLELLTALPLAER